MAHEHDSGIPQAFDRAKENPEWARVVARESAALGGAQFFAQGAEINELQSIIERRTTRLGNLTAKDGDRVDGAAIVVDVEAGTITLGAGAIYVRGDIRPIAERVISGISSFDGDIVVGVRLQTEIITELDDPTLVGLMPGSAAEGEPGAARVAEKIVWALRTESGIDGDFYSTYLVRGGTPIDQTPPPNLSGINQAIGLYDRHHGNYIVTGCRVTALGVDGEGAQAFSIEAGEANIMGTKRTRFTALRHTEPQEPDLFTVAAEPHTFEDSGTGTATIPLNNAPVESINYVTIVRETTEAVTRLTPNNTADPLSHSGVTEILSVTQGATTYDVADDFLLDDDKVDWSPSGAEPAGGSSYNVTYRYLDQVEPDSVTADSVVVTGGVTGTQAIVGYRYKLPRIDILCLSDAGIAVYIKGQSARVAPQPPFPPVTLLKLCEISNDWRGTPIVLNNGTRAPTYDTLWRYLNRVVDLLNLVGLERLQRDIDHREPVAKKGVFVDPFTTNRYRDAGEVQTASVIDGVCSLAIDPTFYPVEWSGGLPIMLDYTEEVVIRQERVTGCMKINPYQNFEPLIGGLALTPSSDFWVETREEWLQDITRVSFLGGNASVRVVDEREELLEFLREIDIAFEVVGFLPDEDLDSLTFAGIDVTPPGLSADEDGKITGNFTIPANVPAGNHPVIATGAGVSSAEAEFVGQGTLEISVMQRVRNLRRRANGNGLGGGSDPLAQTWSLPEHRHILGVDIKPCAIGDVTKGLAIELVDVNTGLPTRNVVAASYVSLAGVTLNAWLSVRHDWPVFRPNSAEYAHVVGTDDGAHALAIASLGELDPQSEEYVGAQPYPVGVLLSSSNARTWTPHQTSDLAFRLIAAKFSPTTKTVDLGTFNLVDCSDLFVRAAVELPTAECSFHFEIERPGGEVIKLQPDQIWRFTSYVTETVELRAVLKGTDKVSPTLYPGVLLVAGKIRAEGTYISRLFKIGTAADFRAWLKTFLPAGATLAVAVDAGDDDWTAVPLDTSEPVDDGWVERQYKVDPFTAPAGRLKLTLAGGPAARPALQDLRAASI